MKNKFVIGFFAVGISAMLYSCNGEPTIDEGLEVDADTLNINTEVEIDMFESPDLDYHLPSALQVASIFKKSGVAFNEGVANNADNVENYTSELQQKLNFGVYSADLAYSITNDQANEARKYITAVKKIAEMQGMEAIFDNKDLMDRFDKNIDNQDSVETIMIEIHERTEEYMDENDMRHTSAIHYAGAWVEGMYLGFYDYEHSDDNKNVGAQITEQIEILDNIIKGLKDPRNNGIDIDWLIKDLENVKETFDNLESVKKFNIDDNAEELILTDEEIRKIGNQIKDIRAKIVNA
jgi:hypothetical protein